MSINLEGEGLPPLLIGGHKIVDDDQVASIQDGNEAQCFVPVTRCIRVFDGRPYFSAISFLGKTLPMALPKPEGVYTFSGTVHTVMAE